MKIHQIFIFIGLMLNLFLIAICTIVGGGFIINAIFNIPIWIGAVIIVGIEFGFMCLFMYIAEHDL